MSTARDTVGPLLSDYLVVLQAVTAAVSALTAVYLVRVTLRRDREARAESERDLVHEQLRRLVDALRGMSEILKGDAYENQFQIARAQVAAALALRPLRLPACEALLADDMPSPPYAMGQFEPWQRVERALEEVVAYSRKVPDSLTAS